MNYLKIYYKGKHLCNIEGNFSIAINEEEDKHIEVKQ